MPSSSEIKIIADRNIPYIREALAVLDGRFTVEFHRGDEISAEMMTDTDILLTRTRTLCNASLLSSSRCSLIATATIGTDHIDSDYCSGRGITVANAPGCNAPAVAQYVLSAVCSLLKPGESLRDKTLGIIGVGNVGSILARWAEGLGIRVLRNDPPKVEADHSLKGYFTLDDLAGEANIISIHTPLTHSGPYATYHLIDRDFLLKTKKTPIIVNCARGAVSDTSALKDAMRSGKISDLVIDCWEGEPRIDRELLDMTAIATPHIAGYSFEGKVRATRMVLEALSSHLLKHFDISDITFDSLSESLPLIPPTPTIISSEMLDYDISADSFRLKSDPTPENFERLRNDYQLRHEPTARH